MDALVSPALDKADASRGWKLTVGCREEERRTAVFVFPGRHEVTRKLSRYMCQEGFVSQKMIKKSMTV